MRHWLHRPTDVARKQDVLQQLKASFDVQPADASKAFTPTLVPALLTVLQADPTDDGEHALRKATLELMGRVKPDEQLKPLAADVLRTCLNVCMCEEISSMSSCLYARGAFWAGNTLCHNAQVLINGTEEAALLALRQIMDAVRIFRQDALDEHVAALLQHFHTIFAAFPDTLQYYLGEVADTLRSQGKLDDDSVPFTSEHVPASKSFKVAIECSWHGRMRVLGGGSLMHLCEITCVVVWAVGVPACNKSAQQQQQGAPSQCWR